MPKKKTFLQDNPAGLFITETDAQGPKENSETPEPRPVNVSFTPAPPEQPPKGYKWNPRFIETKSKRLNCMMQPSLHQRISREAKERGISVNELICQTLEAAFPATDKEREDSPK